jgi:ABC-type sugar transport system permease subunit
MCGRTEFLPPVHMHLFQKKFTPMGDAIMLQKSNKKRVVSYAKYGYLFSIPFILAFLAFLLYPTLFTIFISFTDLKGSGMVASSAKVLANPFSNFISILNNVTFQSSLMNTVIIWIMNFIPQFGLALLLAAWFTRRKRKIRGQGLFKVLFYLPNIITAASIAVLFASLTGYPIGPLNDLLVSTGIVKSPYYFQNDQWTAKIIVAFIQFWIWYGYTTIILISGVNGINPDLFEAAEIDGATPFQTFFKITLPCMRTILIFTLVTSLIGGLNMFDIPKLFIRNGGPADATMTASVFIYSQAFEGTHMYNTAAAASLIMFVIIAALSALIFFLMRDKYEAHAKKELKRRKRELRKAGKAAVA